MWLMSPLSWLLIAAVLCCLGRNVGRGRWMRRAGLALAAVAAMAMTPLVANGLLGWLEAKRPLSAPCIAAPPTVAVVLAESVDQPVHGQQDVFALSVTSRRRVEHAVSWWQAGHGRRLILAGGPHEPGGVATADLMSGYATRLGVPVMAIEREIISTSTWTSAQSLATLHLRTTPRVWLVTSALHMPRAQYAMERAGFRVCALPADQRRVAIGWPGYMVPRSGALAKTEAALHELVGIVYYRWLHERGPGQHAVRSVGNKGSE